MRHATILVAILAFVPLASATAQVRPGGDTLSVPVDLVTKLDVSWDRITNTDEGARIGLLLGGVLGAVTGYASHEECVPKGWFSCIGPDFGPEVSGLGGLVVGAIIGGSPEVRLDRLRVSFGLQRDGWFGLGAGVRF